VQFARALHVTGLMNAQYDIQGGWAPPADRAFSITNRNTVKRLLPENVNDHGKPSVVEVGKRLAEFGFTVVEGKAAKKRSWSVTQKGLLGFAASGGRGAGGDCAPRTPRKPCIQ
jgi:hypothetical protein